MPSFPLPPGGVSPDAGTLPVSSINDALALLPTFLKPDDSAPVRDAILAGLVAMCLAIQDRAAYAAAQADVLRATGAYLKEIGLEHGITSAGDDETDDEYRARILTSPSLVTPEAILAATTSLLAPFTSVLPVYSESFGDRAIRRQRGVAGGPRAYRYRRSSIPRSPDYPDRLYVSEAAQNGGAFIPNREPGAARRYRDRVGRLFLLRVPDVAFVDAGDAAMYSSIQPLGGFFVSDGSANSFGAYLRSTSATSASVYADIVNVVNRIKGQSIRWILLVDPKLA